MSFFIKLDTQNIDEAMDVANHNFSVEKRPLFASSNSNENIHIPDHVAIVNTETEQYLGTVGNGWEPVQPKTIYDLASDLLESTGGKINGVMNMFNGSVIGISFTLAEREYVSGDPVEQNFLMLNSFNGMFGIAGHATTNRISCLNQCNTSNKVYNLRHTRHVGNRLEVVKNMLKYYQNEINLFDDKMMKLVNTRMRVEDSLEWFRGLFPTPKSPRAETMLENQVNVFLECLLEGRGSEISGVKGTSYGTFQALTEYINHHRSIRIHNNREEEEVKFQTIHFGTGNTLAQKGLSGLAPVDFELSEDDFFIK